MKYTKPHLAKSALVAIDTQCDFALPGGAAEIPGGTAARLAFPAASRSLHDGLGAATSLAWGRVPSPGEGWSVT